MHPNLAPHRFCYPVVREVPPRTSTRTRMRDRLPLQSIGDHRIDASAPVTGAIANGDRVGPVRLPGLGS